MNFSTITLVDKTMRTGKLADVQIARADFPSADDQTSAYLAWLRQEFPKRAQARSPDRLETSWNLAATPAKTGHAPERKHIPHWLVCRNPHGLEASISAIIKTQGSDTKLIGQMQPYYEAKGLSRWDLAGKHIPPLVTQIADGENGGVMMNEFPSKYFEVVRECSGSEIPLLNVSEYLEHVSTSGIKEADFPVLQPLFQKRIWDRFHAGDGPEKLAGVIEQLRKEDRRFDMEGGS